MMAATENLVSNFVRHICISNYYLLAFSDHDAIYGSRIMGSTLTTPTQRFNLQGIYSVS
jgi:hypothetical protein